MRSIFTVDSAWLVVADCKNKAVAAEVIRKCRRLGWSERWCMVKLLTGRCWECDDLSPLSHFRGATTSRFLSHLQTNSGSAANQSYDKS